MLHVSTFDLSLIDSNWTLMFKMYKMLRDCPKTDDVFVRRRRILADSILHVGFWIRSPVNNVPALSSCPVCSMCGCVLCVVCVVVSCV